LLQDIKNTLKQSAIYGLSRISSKLVAFILLPLITLNFQLKEYGVYVLTESLWQIFWAVFLFGLESGVVRWYLSIENKDKQKRFLFSVTIFLFILNIVFNVIVFLFLKNLSSVIYENTSYANLVMYASLIASAEAFAFIIFLILRIEEKAKAYSFFSILISVISFVLQVYFLQYTNIKLEGLFISKILAPVIVIIMLLPYYIKHLKIGFEKELLKDLIIYSFPIMLASLVITLLNQADKYILGYLTNLVNVGIYGLAYNISGLLNFLVISPFSLAFTVISWKKLNDVNSKRFYTKTITYLFLAVTFTALVLSLFMPHLIKIFTLRTDYWLAAEYVPWVALSMPFYGIHFVGIFSFYVTKNTKYVLYVYLIALITNVILNFLLIPYLKIYGAAFNNLISFIILNIVIYLFSRKQYFFQYEWLKILAMTICYFILTVPFFYFHFENRTIEILLKILAALLFPLLLFAFNFYEPIEILRVKGFINKYIFKNS